MKKLAFKPAARRGFTLVEVALTAAIGSMLLVSLIYTSREITRAVAGVYNETMLQTVFRDLQTDLESNVYAGLDGATDDNTYSGNSSPFTFSANALTIRNMICTGSNFRFSYEPGNPLADTEGYVYTSNVNTIEALTDMISASRTFQSNIEVINTSRDLMLKTLSMGR